jgi:hypothetical protein
MDMVPHPRLPSVKLAIAGTLASAVNDVIWFEIERTLSGPLIVVAASAGVAQWLVLRRQVSKAGWWVLVSLTGWVVGIAMTWADVQALDALPTLVALGAAAGALSWITIVPLVWLLRQPIPETR